MQPPQDGFWGMPPEMLAAVPGYGPTSQKSREKARAVMKKLGYGPDKRLKLKVSTRNLSTYRTRGHLRRPAQGDLHRRRAPDHRDLAMGRQDPPQGLLVGLNTTGNGVDDPDQNYFENYRLRVGAQLQGYCNTEIDGLIAVQSAERDHEKRKQDRLGDRPQAARGRRAAGHHVEPLGAPAWRPDVKGYVSRSTASTTACASRTSGWIAECSSSPSPVSTGEGTGGGKPQ